MSSNAPSHPLTHADVIGRIIEILEGLLAVLAAQYPDGNLTTGVLNLTCRRLAAYRASNDNPISRTPAPISPSRSVRQGKPRVPLRTQRNHARRSPAHPPHRIPVERRSVPEPPPKNQKSRPTPTLWHAYIVTITKRIAGIATIRFTRPTRSDIVPPCRARASDDPRRNPR
ncbi:hypothetical protein [Acidiphilium acidophilum]|uniref:hypothetical protein n=1 Tax=Acidiphilium acidophilum TaxID=76588 RepID=UPI002E8E69D0|nr:hypothetical protein [Acidiphilium acidophilum]